MLIFDLETDGLYHEVTKIHCFTIYDTSDKSYTRYDPMANDIRLGIERLFNADCLCGHNIINYDIPVLEKLTGRKFEGRVVDTLIWAQITYANIRSGDFGRFRRGELPGKLIGSHSLKAYGYRLGELKGTFSEDTDWQVWTPAMSDYCEQDVRVTVKLYERLEYKGIDPELLDLEQRFQEIITEQEIRGFKLDVKKAEALYMELMPIRDKHLTNLQKIFPPIVVEKKKGDIFTPKADNKRYGYIKGASMCKIKYQEFNPNSGTQIVHRFKKKYQWEPTEFTKKGNPETGEDVLKHLPYPEIPALLEYLMVEKRISQLAEADKAWLKMYNPETHRIHGQVRTMGTNTFRCAHHSPNLAQVPSGKKPYGERCRELFIPDDGYVLVGCDAAALEMRCLAHFLAKYDGGAYIKACIEGSSKDGTDAHSLNAKAIGRTRDEAKTFFYGMIYGAGDTLLGMGDPKLGKRLRNRLLNGVQGFKQLNEAVQAAYKFRKSIQLPTGHTVYLSSAHSALNFLLQGTGAVIMKKALVLLDDELKYRNLRQHMHYVANVHDEFQMEVRPEYAEQVGRLARKSIIKAGEVLNLRCPMDGAYDIGKSWKDTH